MCKLDMNREMFKFSARLYKNSLFKVQSLNENCLQAAVPSPVILQWNGHTHTTV